MVEVLPITLIGDNLGKRHKYLNTLVNDAYQGNASLQSILKQPEATHLDRIFKIELASKHRDIDYIIKNVKDKDMLFVSKALKCQWILENEYRHIVNPVYLENNLYPAMTRTAVNKMKNMIELNLKDPQRCQEFFEYYNNTFDSAIKFLWHCSEEYICLEVLKVMDKLSPKHLRILSEACPMVAKIYFDNLQNNKGALEKYLENKRKYHNSIMNVLKLNADIFLDVIEKYFDRNSLKRLSSSATSYIMKNHKNRYLCKPELYAGWLLNINTLAMFLNSEEIKDIVTRLARAQYLDYSLTYKHVEPLLKRLGTEDRVAIKKMIFVEKSFGDKVAEWPYPRPEQFDLNKSDRQPLQDTRHSPYEYKHSDNFRHVPLSYCFKNFSEEIGMKCAAMKCSAIQCKTKSSLDILFDRYRFVNFDRTFFEFRKLLMAESTIEGRRNMILVLVSKAGDSEAKVTQLLKFLVERHSNEPDHLRDAVARSIVKRAFAWRLPADTWKLLIKWANASVREILHCTILRHLLTNCSCSPEDLAAYFVDFSDMTEYPLSAIEKRIVSERLPPLLVSENAPNLLLDTLYANKIRVESVPGALEMLINAARTDKDIFRRVFELRVARRYLLQESFNLKQTDAAYVNALKHDVSVLKNGGSFVALLVKQKSNHDRFLRTLALYFSEHDGLAARHFKALEKASNEEYRVSFARPLAYLLHADNNYIIEYLTKVDVKSTDQKRFAAALTANASVARPLLDIDVVDWHVMSGKFISNKVLVCSDGDLEKYIQKCLQWRKTTRIVLHLAQRNNSVGEVLPNVIKTRPTVAVKYFLAQLRRGVVDVSVWNQIKQVIKLNLNLSKNEYVKRDLAKAKPMPMIKADYWTCVFEAFRKVSELEAMPMLCRIENNLTQVDENLLDQIIKKFLEEKLSKDLILKKDYPLNCVCLYFRIIAKYLLTSFSSEDQQNKIKTICDPFFDKLELIFKELDNKTGAVECLNDFILSLKYTEAFLDSKYVSCIPMFERILERLPKLLSRARYFKTYAYIHLTILYYRSIVQIMKQRPKMFIDKQLVLTEHVESIGYVLGKYISKEIQDLTENYFGSVLEIYQKMLLEFFHSFEYSDSRRRLVDSVTRGLIQGEGDSLLLAQFVYEEELHDNQINEPDDEILKLLKNADNKEMKFFLYADIYPD